MANGLILLKQIVIMFILMGMGFLLYKAKLISDQGSKDIGKLLLYLVIPVVVINNFCIKRSTENVQSLLYSTLFATLCLGTACLMSYVIFGRRDGILAFSSAFSNAGFIGIPLVQATLGNTAVFYISMMIVLLNILQWTFGVWLMTGNATLMQPKKIITNPIVIAVMIGIMIFTFEIIMPEGASRVFSMISNLNTPLAMIVSGVYLAQTNIIEMFKKKRVYYVCLARLIVIPLVTILIISQIPYGNSALKLSILITACCPVGSNVAIFAQVYDQNYKFAVEQVCMSTLLCVITIPFMMMLAEALL